MPNSPRVSLVMPVFNAEKYLGEAIESILNQTFRDFELITVNDGSTDGSSAILERYQKVDSRIRVFSQPNQGPAGAKNLGCSYASGKYIALIDADDVCMPQRLARQITYLEAHPTVGLSGSWFRISRHEGEITIRHPIEDAAIRCQMLFDSPLANSTVMMRRALVHEVGLRFDLSYLLAEDYHFWVSASQYCQMANLPEILVFYRQHEGQISGRKRQTLLKNSGRIRMAQLRKLELEPTKEEFSLHQAISVGEIPKNRDFILRSEAWLRRLLQANRACSLYPELTFTETIGTRWYYVCKSAASLGIWTWKTYLNSALFFKSPTSAKRTIYLALKCIRRS